MSTNEPTHYGAWIRERREQRGLTLEEVSSRIRIDAKYLQALETGNIALLPEPYMRAFLKTYASFLGLDTREAARRFEAFVQEQREREEKVRSALKEKDSRRGVPAPGAPQPAPQTARETDRGNSAAWLWALGVVVLFAAAGYLGWTLTGAGRGPAGEAEQVAARAPSEETSPAPAPPDTAVQQREPQQRPQQQEQEEAARAQLPPVTEPSEEVRAEPEEAPSPRGGAGVFEAVAVDSTWIQVSWGQTIYVSRVVPPGARVRVPVSDSLQVKSGRSSGMRYYFGGEEIAPVWPEGRVLTLVLTREGVVRRRWSLPPDGPAGTIPELPNVPPLP